MRTKTLLAAALLAAPASAQALKPFTDCATIADDGARLACYDRAAAAASPAAAQAAEKRADAAAAAAAQAAARADAERTAAFGRGSMRDADTPGKAETETLGATIRAVSFDREKKALVTLDNGQVWKQSSTKMPSGVRPGSKVTLKEGTLGSVRMVVDAPGTQVMWVVRVR